MRMSCANPTLSGLRSMALIRIAVTPKISPS
jgi:hypothetical protein